MDSSKSSSIVAYKVYENNLEKDETNEKNVCELTGNIMCILNQNTKIAAAYYDFHEQVLFVYEEMVDSIPEYQTTEALYHEIQPSFVVSIGKMTDDFIKTIIDIMANRDSFVSSTSVRKLPKNLALLSLKQYSYEASKRTLFELDLASNKYEIDDSRRELYVNSLINFDNKFSVHAAGIIVRYLDKNWANFGLESKEKLIYLDMVQVSRKNRVMIDTVTFRTLRVFAKLGHDATFKRGVQSSGREGMSIFKLFSDHCKSRIGSLTLKHVLLNPLKDVEILNNRLQFIKFCLDPSNSDFIESLKDSIKEITNDLYSVLTKVITGKPLNRDWDILQKSIRQVISVNNLCVSQRNKAAILMQLNDTVTKELITLDLGINQSIDISGPRRDRPVIRFGLDEELDAKKLRHQDIIKDVTGAARLAANIIPDFVKDCAIVFLPEMGHLIALGELKKNYNPQQLENFGFEYVFTLKKKLHYKNALCVELDERLGNLSYDIIDHENRIIRRLSRYVAKFNTDIRQPYKVIGMIDCLMSMAAVAAQNNFVEPTLNETNVIEIEGSRHPLNEHVLEQFQCNNFYSGGPHSYLKIITGPNGSGKSMYLKQVSLILYMAHVGSYLPAKKANVTMLSSIHAILQTTETISLKLSTFMKDVMQVSRALRNYSSTSLILLDEFGRGTVDEDAIGILGGVLKSMIDNPKNCPHILVSTHFQLLSTYLPQTPLIQYQTMKYSKENGNLYFLYKLINGMSTSYALEVAETLELDKDILETAREMMAFLTINSSLKPVKNYNSKFPLSNDFTTFNLPNYKSTEWKMCE